MHLLRVLDCEHAHPAHRGLMRKESLEHATAVALVVLFEGEAVLPEHLEQKLTRPETLATHACSHNAIVDAAQQSAHEQALAAAVTRRHNAKARTRPEQLAHEFQRAQMLLAREK